MAVQADLGRLLPEKAKLRAPVYYSYSTERTTPKYNPLDQDVLLDDALDDCRDKHERDSILAYAEESTVIRNFSISGLNFGVKSKKPMPWDPANFTINFSYSKQTKKDPTTDPPHYYVFFKAKDSSTPTRPTSSPSSPSRTSRARTRTHASCANGN